MCDSVGFCSEPMFTSHVRLFALSIVMTAEPTAVLALGGTSFDPRSSAKNSVASACPYAAAQTRSDRRDKTERERRVMVLLLFPVAEENTPVKHWKSSDSVAIRLQPRSPEDSR